MIEFMGEETTLKMMIGSAYIPKRNKLKPFGEDAHFISQKHQTFAVADGVGSWARKGIDAGKYARQLMKNANAAVHCQSELADVNPKRILNKAFSKTSVKGSSTACVITLRHDNILQCVNVGDSGFVVIRGGEIVYKSPVQQRRFNCPYQLASEQADIPNNGDEISIEMEVWDIIVAGTDGLFDNVFDNELEEVVGLGLDEAETPEKMARLIAEYALEKASDSLRISPFERAALAAGVPHLGGKYDDITVVVAYVFPFEDGRFELILSV